MTRKSGTFQFSNLPFEVKDRLLDLFIANIEQNLIEKSGREFNTGNINPEALAIDLINRQNKPKTKSQWEQWVNRTAKNI